ncbi:anti-sigma factor family protein [Rhodomicrobium sp.]|uniref:anti-sigma factor family protein n=1 Tax=Rhodomicrobium sp. TaxID=2720632 RepID=UPI0039E68C2E
MTQLSDEFLLAYLDGQLEKTQAAEVTQLSSVNAEVSRRIARLKRTQAQLIETFGAFAREDVSVPKAALQTGETDAQARPQRAVQQAGARLSGNTSKVTHSPAAARQMVFVAAVFLGGLLGGYGATLLAGDPAPLPAKDTDRPLSAVIAPTAWPTDIARFHSYFPRETLTPYPDAIANPELIRFQLSKITGRALTPPDFSKQGYTLYRGQTFNYRQDRMMQLTYSSKTEPPITFYALPGAESGDSEVAVQTVGSLKGVSWVFDRVRFFITSDRSEEDLKVLAAIAQSQTPKR